MKRCKRQTVYIKRRGGTCVLLLLLLIPLLFHNASCTMFLIKEGVKEIKKLEEERKEKKQQQERQWETQLPDSYDAPPADSPQRRHNGQWTPDREK